MRIAQALGLAILCAQITFALALPPQIGISNGIIDRENNLLLEVSHFESHNTEPAAPAEGANHVPSPVKPHQDKPEAENDPFQRTLSRDSHPPLTLQGRKQPRNYRGRSPSTQHTANSDKNTVVKRTPSSEDALYESPEGFFPRSMPGDDDDEDEKRAFPRPVGGMATKRP